MKRVIWSAAALVAMVAGLAQSHAHFFWLQPDSYRTLDSKELVVRLFIGHADKLREGVHVRFAFKRFVAVGPKGTVTVRGKLRGKPAGRVNLKGKGVHTLVYESRHTNSRIELAKFTKYLREKGLQSIIAERARRGESKKDGNESYARNCKALVRVGNGSRGYQRRVKLPLELTPLSNPFRARRNVRFVLERDGSPLAGAKVELISLDAKSKDALTSAITDAKGLVTFKIPKPGRWMLSSIFMRRAQKPITGDWESFWANLTFEAR